MRLDKAAGMMMVVAVVWLQGCGGGDSPVIRPDPPSPASPDSSQTIRPGGSLPAGYQGTRPPSDGVSYYTVDRIGPPGEYAYAGGDAVRIGILDDAVDFTHSAFRGRIELDGATFSYWRPLAAVAQRGAFDDCDASRQCRVYLVDSKDDPGTLEALARTVLEDQGLPPGNNLWFLHDAADGELGWFELPALGLDDPDLGAQHGTGVAGVAARQAPESVLIPMALNYDEQTEYLGWLRGYLREIESDPSKVLELDATLARELRSRYESADIINASYATPVDLEQSKGRTRLEEHVRETRLLKALLPRRWRAYTQRDRPEGERTIQVWAAGNERDDRGIGARSLEALELHYFDELRGHNVVVTALNEAGTELADYAHVCGELPEDWDASRHGRHFCLAAPGTHRIAVPGDRYEDDVAGTSYAAPYVTGVLARMKARSRGQVGNTELVKRLIDTAITDPPFDDLFYYGAGVVDHVAALGAVGVQMTGTQRHQAPLRATSLRLPAAYGDAAQRLAGMEIASFDAWNFPFWTPASELVDGAEHDLDPIPTFTETEDAGGCFVTRGYAPEAVCVPWAADGRISGLVAADGAGVSGRLWPGVTVAGFTRSSGRLDGRATGAFSFAGGSSLGAAHFTRSRVMDDDGRWRLDGRLTVAVDSPQGVGRSEGSMFEAGPALLSSWTVGLTHTGKDTRTRLSLSQPPRAESGTGRLSYPSGRQLDGTRIHETRTFSLRPSRRMVTANVTHRRPLAGGEMMVSVHRAEHPGHSAGPAVHGGGVAWRWAF